MLLKAGFVMMSFAMALAGVTAAIVWTEEPARSAAVKSAQQGTTEPLKRTDPGFEPWKEEKVKLSTPGDVSSESAPGTQSTPKPETEPQPETTVEQDPEPPPKPRPEPSSEPERDPIIEDDPPKPTKAQIASAYEPRDYDLPDGAVLGLTVKAIGLRNVPVFDSIEGWSLASGVGHHPQTSMPWTNAPQRNVYLAGHKLGYPGTASHLVFYRLGELGEGDEILLRDRDGTRYRYRVSETFKANPSDSWVMGQVVGRDMVTLQTCVGPNWEQRLIVRADRV